MGKKSKNQSPKDDRSVFIVINLANKKIYIGSTFYCNEVKYIKDSIISQIVRKPSIDQSFRDNYDTNGKAGFVVDILERVKNGNYAKHRDYWIDYFDSKNPDIGYNV